MVEPSYRAAVVASARCCVRAAIWSGIERELAAWDLREFASLAALVESVETEAFYPDLVIVCQSWRDEYAADEVKVGLACLPVARWICVAGPWCESEGRHGSRWPFAVRVPLRTWETRLANEIAVVQGTLPALVITAAREEVFDFDRQGPLPKFADEATVSILSPDREWRAWMSDLCQQGGLGIVDASEARSPDLWILDLDPWTEDTVRRVQSLKGQHPQSKFIGLMGLLYTEDRGELEAIGLKYVLCKLSPARYLLTCILETVDEAHSA